MGKSKASNKSGAPGTEGVSEAWAKAANGSGGDRDTKPSNVPVQTALDLGDKVVEFQTIDLLVPVSDDEAELLDREASDLLAEANSLQADLDVFVAEHVTPKKAAIKDKLKTAGEKAKESRDRKRRQAQRVEVTYYPTRATVEFRDPVTGKQVQVSRAMTPAEMSRLAEDARALPPPPADAERVTLDDVADDPEQQF